MNKLKIVFLGTPEIACPFLNRIAADGHSVSGVISQPDRLQGRGMKLCCPPVKNKAGELKLEIFQPRSHEDLAFILSELKPDLGVVVAYGRLIKKEALAIPRLGFINVHFSLLPAYRGAAPVQWSLIKGETVTGATVFWLDEGMDTGPVLASREVPVSRDDYAPELFKKTADAGIELLSECLSEISAADNKDTAGWSGHARAQDKALRHPPGFCRYRRGRPKPGSWSFSRPAREILYSVKRAPGRCPDPKMFAARRTRRPGRRLRRDNRD